MKDYSKALRFSHDGASLSLDVCVCVCVWRPSVLSQRSDAARSDRADVPEARVFFKSADRYFKV